MRSILVAAGLAAIVLAAACGTPREPERTAKTQTAPAAPAAPRAHPEAADAAAQITMEQAQAGGAQQKYAVRSPMMAPASVLPSPRPLPPMSPVQRERYAHLAQNPVHAVGEDPVSTFSVDVDTGSYANLRRFLQQGRLPPEDAVRIEEFINAFDYAYPAPGGTAPSTPFSVQTEVAPTPWNAKTLLLRVGIQGWRPQGPLPPSNLVFLVDVSGSMQAQDKLPLLQSSLRLLVGQLRAKDRISLISYASGVRTVLEPTAGDQRATILAAIDDLVAGGSTNGGDGIRRAYDAAHQARISDGINRILLCTDGDFNVGTVDFEQLKDLVERERAGGVALSTFGFGQGNYNDHLMEQLADAGNGSYGYIDTLMEAQKLFVRNRAATLRTIAKDVKVQVEFNPALVAEYRLIGYENRALAREDFANDKVDAGEIGAGHSVTALYEIALVGSGGQRLAPLRYQPDSRPLSHGGELALLRLRYKTPDGDVSKLIERPVAHGEVLADFGQASESTRWAASIAAFGQSLRGGKYLGSYGYPEIRALAAHSRGADPYGDRAELLKLIDLAQSLAQHTTGTDVASGH